MRSTKLLVRSLVGLFLPLFCVVDMEKNNGVMMAAGELTMLSRLLIVPGGEHAVQIIWVIFWSLVLRPRGSMVLQGSHIMNEPGILWSTLAVQISGVKHLRLVLWYEAIYSALRGPWSGLVVAPAEKASLLHMGSQFDSKQCGEQFITPLSCLPQSRCNSFAFRTPVLLRLLLILTHMVVRILRVFPLFL